MREWYRTRWLFSFAALLAVMLAVLVLWLLITDTGRIWPKDFEVFCKAGERAAAGENLYRPIEDGFYHYKYSPAAALLFIPLTVLPLDVAGIVFRVALIFIILIGLYLAMRITDADFPKGDALLANRTVLLAGMVLSMHFYSELTLGQVNQIVITAGLAAALLITREKRPWLASGLLALGVILKPFLLIFLPYLLLRRRWRELGGFVIFSGALLLLPAVFYRSGEFIHQDRKWLDMLGEQLDGGHSLLEAGNHTIYSFLVRVTPLRWLAVDSWNSVIYSASILLLLALGVLWLAQRGGSVDNREALDFAMLMLLVPLLVVTSENGFGFAELAMVLLLFNAHKRAMAERAWLSLGLGLFLLGTLVNQISGPWIDPVLNRVHDWSLITAGILVLLGLLCFKRYRQRL